MQMIFASNNPGKVREVNQMLSPQGIELFPQSDLGISEVEETGLTFIENALIKARHVSQYASMPVLADDSGLVVPAIAGQPGILSARYAGKQASSDQNIAKLLNKLEQFPKDQRQAYFYCVIVYLRHHDDPCPIICQGKWDGSILMAPRGQQGFGYDSIFFDETEQRSAAELSPEVKNKISHRGQAIAELIKLIANKSI